MPHRRQFVRIVRATTVLATLTAAVTVAPAVAPAHAATASVPVITSMSGHDAPVSGRVPLTIHGRGLTGVYRVVFGSHDTLAVHHLSSTAIRVRVPHGALGLVNVRVQTPTAISVRSVHTHFRFVPAPTVSRVSRTAGMTEGGQRIAVRGRDFRSVESVRFGSTQGRTVHVVSPSLLWVTTPAHRRGPVDLVVHTAFGTSNGARFEFGPRPAVHGVGPTYGSTRGGTQLDISGVSFEGYLSVLVDGTRMTRWSKYGARDLTIDMPAHRAGYVHVQVANQYGTSRTTSADLFRYLPPDPQRWGTSRLVDADLGVPQAVSCATNLCAMVDAKGGLFTQATSGASWHEDVAPTTNGIQWMFVSCASDDLCFASGSGGKMSRFDGHSWTTPAVVPDVGYMVAMSCPAVTACHAVTEAGADLTWDGSSWQVAHDRGAPLVNAMRCSSVDSCNAIDSHGGTYDYSAGTWTRTGTVSAAGAVSAACTAVECVAVAADKTTYVLDSRWSVAADPAPFGVFDLACAHDGACTGVDGHGDTATFVDGTWTSGPTVHPAEYQQVGCRAQTSCTVMDDEGYVVALEGGVASAPTSVDPTQGGASRLSCAQTLCVLLDQHGNAFTRIGSGGWSRPTKLAPDGQEVDCATARWCVAIADHRTFVYDGARWTEKGAVSDLPLWALSCPAAGSCVGAGGSTLSRFDGSRWSVDRTLGQALDGVSCSAPGHCLAIGEKGGQYRLDGRTWTSVPGAPRLAAHDMQRTVACPTDLVCFVGDYSGAVIELHGSTWTSTAHVHDYARTLTCTSASRCITIGPRGVSTFDGTTWTAPAPIARAPYGDSPWYPEADVAAVSGKWLVASIGYVFESV